MSFVKVTITKKLVAIGLCAWGLSLSQPMQANEQNEPVSPSVLPVIEEPVKSPETVEEETKQAVEMPTEVEKVAQPEEATSEEPKEEPVETPEPSSEAVEEKSEVKETENTEKSEEITNTKEVKPVATVTKSTRYFTVSQQIPVYNNGPKSENILVGYVLPDREYQIRRFSDDFKWAVINFGDKNAYIRISQITPSTGKNFKNPVKTTKRTGGFLTNSKAAVYEESSNTSKIYSYLEKGVNYSVIGKYYNFYMIDVGGKTGYIHVDNLQKEPKTYTHFIPKKNISVYHQNDVKGGADILVGTLLAGQEYKITRFSDGTNWIVVDFGHKNAYIRTSDTTLSEGKQFKNGVKTKLGKSQVTINSKAAAYKVGDNKPANILSYLETNVTYQVLGKYHNYYLVNIGGRYGYVHKDNTKLVVKNLQTAKDTFEDLGYKQSDTSIESENGSNPYYSGSYGGDSVKSDVGTSTTDGKSGNVVVQGKWEGTTKEVGEKTLEYYIPTGYKEVSNKITNWENNGRQWQEPEQVKSDNKTSTIDYNNIGVGVEIVED